MDTSSDNKVMVFRLQKGQDLNSSLQQIAMEHKLEAAWIITAIGSLAKYHIRFANQSQGSRGEDFFEIIHLGGTLSMHGSHLHIGISDSRGRTIGGHLLEGCVIYTTAEIVIGYSTNLVFTRQPDEISGFHELSIQDKKDLKK